MITVDNRRIRGMEEFPLWSGQRPVQDAFRQLAVSEFGFGGIVETLSETTIVVFTRVMGCVDRTTFSGSEGDMASLFRLAVLVNLVETRTNCERIREEAIRSIVSIPELNKPLITRDLLPMLLRGQIVRSAVLVALGQEDINVLTAELEAGESLKLRDFVAAVQLAREQGVSLAEVV